MKLLRYQYKSGCEINIAPLIDVVFLLIAFFMMVSQFTQAQLEDIELPQAQERDQAREEIEKRIVVNVLPDGGMLIDGLSYTDEKFGLLLQAELTSRSPDSISILIRSDRKTPWGIVSGIMAQCARRQIFRVKVGVVGEEMAVDSG